MNNKTPYRILGLCFFIHLCIFTFFVFNSFKAWGGVSRIYVGEVQLLFWIKFSLQYVLCLSVVILFFLNQSSVKWIVLLYIIWSLLGGNKIWPVIPISGKVWPIIPNSPYYYDSYNTMMRTLFETSRSLDNVVRVIYSHLFLPLFYAGTLLYVFFCRSRLWREKWKNKIKSFYPNILISFILFFIPYAIICFAFLMRKRIIYDIDAPVLAVLLFSPILFIVGTIISVKTLTKISKEKKLEKILGFIGAVLNFVSLIINIWLLMNIRM